MATLTEKLQFLLTADASSALKGFRSVEQAADKTLAKTETGASKGMAAFQKYGAIAGSAGLVIGAAALKAAGAFEHLALSAGKLADSTGLTTEAASRWIEVAGDMGIEVATVETAVSKMDKALASTPAKFEELGVAIAHTADGAVDVNGTFLNAVDVINGIKDPMQRAKVASELFGKGWTSMSELIATGSDRLKESLAGVDASKVITDGELGKAKDYRDAMDNLRDKFGELALKVGEELVPVLTDAANLLSGISKVAGPVLGEVVKGISALGGGKADALHRAGAALLTFGGSEVNRGLRTLIGNLKDVEGEMAIPPERLREIKAAADELTPEMERAALVTKAQGAAAVIAAQNNDTLGVVFGTTAIKAGEMESAATDTAKALDKVRTAWDLLMGALDDREAQRAIDDAQQRLDDLIRSGGKNPSGKRKAEIAAASDDVIRLRVQQAEKLALAQRVSPNQRTADARVAGETTFLKVAIQPYIDQGAADEVERRLAALAQMRVIPFEPVIKTPTGLSPLTPDGGLDSGAVAEAIAKAKREGKIPP